MKIKSRSSSQTKSSKNHSEKKLTRQWGRNSEERAADNIYSEESPTRKKELTKLSFKKDPRKRKRRKRSKS